MHLAPWYVWRPTQVVRRLALKFCPPSRGYQPLPVAWGGSIVADPTRPPLGRALANNGIYDIAVSECLSRLIRPGQTVVDAGANLGYMTVLMSRLVGPTGTVWAFEPHPELFQVLLRNAGASGPLINEALGAESGTAELIIPETANDGVAFLSGTGAPEVTTAVQAAIASTIASTTLSVPLTTIDETIGEKRIAVMKVDVEGSELGVLQGAYQALGHHRITHVIFEDHVGQESPVCNLLLSYGYTLFALGYSLWGPRIAPIGTQTLASPHEAPSYLATLEPEEVEVAMAPRGWKVLRTLP